MNINRECEVDINQNSTLPDENFWGYAGYENVLYRYSVNRPLYTSLKECVSEDEKSTNKAGVERKEYFLRLPFYLVMSALLLGIVLLGGMTR